MELQALYPAKPILKVFAELFSKSDRPRFDYVELDELLCNSGFPFTRVLQSANQIISKGE